MQWRITNTRVIIIRRVNFLIALVVVIVITGIIMIMLINDVVIIIRNVSMLVTVVVIITKFVIIMISETFKTELVNTTC